MNREWWVPFLQMIIGGLAMTAVMGWVARSRLRERSASELCTLRHPVSTLVIGCVCGGFFFGIAIISNTIGKNPTATVWTTALFLGFGLSGVSMIADYFFARHRVSDLGIEYGRMLGQRGSLPWAGVRSVKFAPVMKWFVLEGDSGLKVRVSALLLGLPQFAHYVLLHVPSDSIDPYALEILQETEQGELPDVSA